MTAMEELNSLLVSLPGSSLLTDAMKQRALDIAQVPDSFNVWPGQPGYEPTYDPYWAAISLIGFLQAQPVVRQSSSEGTSVSVDAPNWAGLLAYYRSMSPVSQGAQSGPLLVAIPIPHTPHVYRTDMNERWSGYDDIDTDAS